MVGARRRSTALKAPITFASAAAPHPPRPCAPDGSVRYEYRSYHLLSVACAHLAIDGRNGLPVTKPVVLLAEELSPATIEALGPDFEIRRCDGANRDAEYPINIM